MSSDLHVSFRSTGEGLATMCLLELLKKSPFKANLTQEMFDRSVESDPTCLQHCASYNNSILVECHPVELLNRIQVRVIEGKITLFIDQKPLSLEEKKVGDESQHTVVLEYEVDKIGVITRIGQHFILSYFHLHNQSTYSFYEKKFSHKADNLLEGPKPSIPKPDSVLPTKTKELQEPPLPHQLSPALSVDLQQTKVVTAAESSTRISYRTSFRAENTRLMPFTDINGVVHETEFMIKTGHFSTNWQSEGGYWIVEIDANVEGLSELIIMPMNRYRTQSQHQTPHEILVNHYHALEQQINNSMVEKHYNERRVVEITLYMPRIHTNQGNEKNAPPDIPLARMPFPYVANGPHYRVIVLNQSVIEIIKVESKQDLV